MATTQILLREDVDNLGGRGEIVSVKSGFARNYLLPRGFAMLATKGNIKQVEQERSQLLKKAAEERSTAEAQLEQMKELSFDFERMAGESGTLFGSVTSIDIASAFEEKGYEIDRRKIILKNPIKELGDYTIPVKLHRDVTLELPITVSLEGEAKKEKLSAAETKAMVEESEVVDASETVVSTDTETTA